MLKIIIEHEEARSSNLNGGGSVLSDEGKTILDIVFEKQLAGNWCWAAVSKMIYHYYYNREIDQKIIVSNHFGVAVGDLEIKGKVNGVYDKEVILNQTLEGLSCFSHWSLGKPTFERLQYEINAGKPLCCRIEWYTGNAHYVVVHGYDVVSKSLYIIDSKYGSSIMSYDEFPNNYRKQGGAWTETFWTCKRKEIITYKK